MSDHGFIPKSAARKLVNECSDNAFLFGYLAGAIQWVLTFVLLFYCLHKDGFLVWVKH